MIQTRPQSLLIAIFAFTIANFTQAQTLTAPDLLAGDSFTMGVLIAASPEGQPGENMVWDYSNLTPSDSYNGQYLPASPSAYEDDYPGATWRLEANSQTAYYNFGPDFFEFFGGIEEGASYPLSNSERFFPYPYNYGETHEDDMGGILNIQGVTTYRSGLSQSALDGYGSLALPVGVQIEDVLRIRVNRSISDSTIMGTTQYVIDQIFFTQNGLVAPLITHTFLQIIVGIDTTEYNYTEILQAYLMGVEDIAPQESYSFALFPNPAQDKVQMVWGAAPEIIEIRDAAGRLVKSLTGIPGISSQQFDVSEWAPGMYTVTAISGDAKKTKQLIVE
jgi:hypothetical protein